MTEISTEEIALDLSDIDLELDDVSLDTSCQVEPLGVNTAQQSVPLGQWFAVSNSKPCAVCGGKRKCTYTSDGTVAKCCKVGSGAFKSTQDDVGEAHYHRLADRPTSSNGTHPATATAGNRDSDECTLPAERLHEIYGTLLQSLPSMQLHHLAALLKRGQTSEQIKTYGYRSVDRATAQSRGQILYQKFGDDLFQVPGISKWDDGSPKLYFPHIKTVSGSEPVKSVLVIPVRNKSANIVRLKLRIDDPAWEGSKYLWFSAAKSGGTKSGVVVHVPKGTPASCETVRVTEGELKADTAFALDGCPVISLPGVSSHAKALPILAELGAKQVMIAFDADCRTNPDVARSLRKFYKSLIDAGYQVGIEHWDIADGKGIDDLLAGGKIPQLATGDAAAEFVAEIIKSSGADPAEKQQPAANSNRNPKIYCSFNELAVNDEVISHLAKVETIFQRGGSLVRVIRDPVASPGIVRPVNAPSIQDMPESGLREILSSILVFEDMGKDGLIVVRVPSHVSKAIHQRGQWAGIRKLESVVTFPVIRADGSVASTPGYDPLTGLFLHIPDNLVAIPDSLGVADARAAVDQLRDIVNDFPFQAPEHFSCWLAMLLTPLARFAFSGPSPLFMIDANTPGSGKTLLAELFSQIVAGSDFARLSPCRDDDEMRKRITAIAMRSDPLILLDNVAGDLGGSSLDAALTSTSWTDRILGASRQVTLPLYAVWIATGNNIVLAADMTRRVCHIRLTSHDERPEERTGFKYSNVLEHVKENRSALLTAGLTILAAYFRAGRPQFQTKPWGSFEGWSSVVRQAVIWVGEVDPAESRKELAENSDSGTNSLHDLIAAWQEADTNQAGLTVSDAISFMQEFHSDGSPKGSSGFDGRMRLRNAVAEVCGTPPSKLPSAVSFGKYMKKYRGRVIDGRCFEYRENTDKVKVWKVIESRPAGDTRDVGDIFSP